MLVVAWRGETGAAQRGERVSWRVRVRGERGRRGGGLCTGGGSCLQASDGFNGSLPFLTWYQYLDSFAYQRSRYVKYGHSNCAMIVSGFNAVSFVDSYDRGVATCRIHMLYFVVLSGKTFHSVSLESPFNLNTHSTPLCLPAPLRSPTRGTRPPNTQSLQFTTQLPGRVRTVRLEI